jgi:GT2 family glycosyltransferase
VRDGSLAVIIPSLARPATLHETLLSVLRQSRRAGQIIVSVPGEEHVLPESLGLPGVTLVLAEIGSARQRNRAIAALRSEAEIVAFLDDDVELHEDYLAQVGRLFDQHPDAMLIDGKVLAEGRGMLRAEAQEIIAGAGKAQPRAAAIGPEQAYGCNMTVRRRALASVRFDERLPLYGYMEDRDFAFECARLGRILRCESAWVVHLRPPAGRLSHRRFGFSQVMNPLYLWRKGNYLTRRNVAWQVSRPLVVNSVLALAPRRGARHRGLLAGNVRALGLALRGRIAPENVLQL